MENLCIYKLKEVHTNIHIFVHYLWNHMLKERTMKELLKILCKKKDHEGTIRNRLCTFVMSY
jgi:hypothetical protein